LFLMSEVPLYSGILLPTNLLNSLGLLAHLV